MGLRGVWAYNSTVSEILNTGYGPPSKGAQFLRAISPGSGAYQVRILKYPQTLYLSCDLVLSQNEADLHEPNHQGPHSIFRGSGRWF
jgi:hypothetical protein